MITNITKGKLISAEHRLCEGIFSKARGLMFTRRIRVPLVFNFRREAIIPIHMLFVFYPIDVLWLDRAKRVVELKRSLKPFTVMAPGAKASYVLELEQGAISSSGTEIGDVLDF